jgi:hypothetical protein
MIDWKDVLKNVQFNMLTDIANNIKDVLDDRDINASGRLKASIRVGGQGDGYVLFAEDYLQTALEGVPPNSKPISELQSDILKWLGDKGLNQNDGLAYLIARKINNEGSVKYRNPNERIFLSDIVNNSVDYSEIQNDLTNRIRENL